MQQQLLNHIARHSLCKATDKILLAVSGGIDSMVMLHLCRQAGLNIGVAHCNFQLRGEEADKDERLVIDECQKKDIPVFTTRFETSSHAEEFGLSIQMAARNLRYEFFEQVSRKGSYHVIATAHNLNDVFETLLLNLTKGTGFEGITGIPVKNGKIIRPLLFADRKMIEHYARENNIIWREDASNASDDYQRNFIRNKVMVSLREINPNLEDTFRQTLERLNASAHITREYLVAFREKNVVAKGDEMHINISAIRNEAFPSVILWELIKDLGFNFDQCSDIVKVQSPGRTFLSEGFELIVDRASLIVHHQSGHEVKEVDIQPVHQKVTNGKEFLILHRERNGIEISNDDAIAFLDGDRVTFPLRWRKWKNGDAFRPLGMKGQKKVSDFLIDKKMPLHEKANVTVLESNGEIIWVVGQRISDNYKITDLTKEIIVIRSEKSAVKKNS